MQLDPSIRFFFLTLVLTFSSFFLQGQGSTHDLNEAKAFFSHEKYSEALSILVNSRKLNRDNKEAKLLIAICYFELNKLEKSLALLKEMVNDRKAPYPECWLFLGKCYHASNQFAEAGKYYKLYLRAITPNHPNRRMVREDIRRISNGIEWQFRHPLAVVENLGQGVNTEWDEFKPIPSPNANRKVYFSSARRGSTGGARKNTGVIDEKFGHYFSDIYSCKINKGIWGTTTPLHYLLNSPSNEILYDFNKAGSVLFYFKGWAFDEGEIIVDTFRQESQRTLNSTPFVGPVLSSIGDGDLFFYNDTLLLFSSNRKGGFGGKDIYRSVLKGGRWSIPRNLGPIINTPFDEKSPFLAADGKTLYFSSNDSHKSIGGYDVFKSTFVTSAQRWSDPKNVGIPINSAGNDVDFKLSTDGFTAFFASSRKEGMGRRDLYTAYFQKFLPEMNPPTPAPVVVRQPIPEREAIQTMPPVEKKLPKQSPAFPILNFDTNTTDLSEQQEGDIDKVFEILHEALDLELVITCYSQFLGKKSAELIIGMQKGELVAAYLQNKGIEPNRILVRSVSVPSLNVTPFLLDFAIAKSVNNDWPTIGENYETQAKGSGMNHGLLYQLQVSSSKKTVPLKWLDLFENPMIEKLASFAYYRYSVGGVSTYEEAISLKGKLMNAGKKDAYIVAYLYGTRSSKKQAKKYLDQFADLKNYTN